MPAAEVGCKAGGIGQLQVLGPGKQEASGACPGRDHTSRRRGVRWDAPDCPPARCTGAQVFPSGHCTWPSKVKEGAQRGLNRKKQLHISPNTMRNQWRNLVATEWTNPVPTVPRRPSLAPNLWPPSEGSSGSNHVPPHRPGSFTMTPQTFPQPERRRLFVPFHTHGHSSSPGEPSAKVISLSQAAISRLAACCSCPGSHSVTSRRPRASPHGAAPGKGPSTSLAKKSPSLSPCVSPSWS